MNDVQRSACRVRFGAFEFNPQIGELLKHGLKIKLSGQPVEVLAMLLERPGQLVTREELQKRLWPNDTVVEFEHSINAAINRLREALSDSADDPRYVETLPRRGYRFIAPVRSNGGAAGEQPGARLLQSEVAQPAQRRLPRVAVLVAAAVLGLVALAYLLRPSPPSPKVLQIVQLTDDRRPKPGFMVTDGPRLYFTEIIADHFWPVGMSTAGGETVPIATPFQNAVVLDISADGSELLMQNVVQGQVEQALWAVPVLGGSPRRLSDLQASEAIWSPDGQKILYIKNDSHLYLAKSDGTDSRELAKVPGSSYDIRWSPDGSRISVSVDNEKSNMLWEVSADGTNLHPVLPDWNFDQDSCNAHWTSDGKYLLFDSYQGGPDNIWAIPQKGSFFYKVSRRPVQLTTGPLNIGTPVPSKDGKRIFVISREQRPQLDRYDSKSGEWTPFLSGISAKMVDFSRDGKWVAYVTVPEGNLFRSKADGSQRLQLSFAPITAQFPRWSPDGRKIAFSAQAPGKPSKICLISAKGGNLEQLTQGEGSENQPTWSPDGNWLAFGSGAGVRNPVIHLLDLRTRQVSTLPGSEGYYAPEWSPEGRYLATQKGDEGDLMLFDFTTRRWQELRKAFVGTETWSRDGKYLYFSAFGKDEACLRVRISDRKLERVANFKSLRHPNWWMGLTPDDSPLMLSVFSIQEIYALDWEAP
jgi:Tol biopolymer transport system component/DNA-binding winged helix-turn-helix (wHTH) protein